MIVIDSSAILAYMNAADSRHADVATWLDGETEELVTTPLVVAEVDHLVSAHGGAAGARALRADLLSGAYILDWWQAALATTAQVAARYADNELGLTDASLVALADRHHTVRIATLDERHFRAVRPLRGGDAFHLLPRDG